MTLINAGLAPEVHDIMLIANNECGSDTLVEQVTVYPPNVAAFISVDTSMGCQPFTVPFTELATPGTNISWDFGDGNTSEENNPVHTFDSAGVFTVVQYASLCGTHTDTTIITVHPAPEVDFSHPPFACAGQPFA